MPGAEHEAIAELVSLKPDRVAAFLTACLGVEVPEFAVARIVDSNLSDRNPIENQADNVLLLEDRDGKKRFAVVFEIQRQADGDKDYAWFLYLAMTRRVHKCPTMVVVIATTKAAATFASTRIETGHPGCSFKPVVWDPDGVPRVDAEEVGADPCLASLAVIIRQDETDQLHAFAECLNHLDGPEARFYAGLALRALAEDRRKLLEEIMANEPYDYWAELSEQMVQEGRQEGRQEAVLTVLTARKLAVSAAVRDRIRRCRDTNQLTTWLQRAATAKRADDLFA